jgi:hypothetical protein
MIFPHSHVTYEGTTYFLAKLLNGERYLGLSGETNGFSGGIDSPSADQTSEVFGAAFRKEFVGKGVIEFNTSRLETSEVLVWPMMRIKLRKSLGQPLEKNSLAKA